MPCLLCEEVIVPGELVTHGAPYEIANSIPPEIVERAECKDLAIHVRCQNDYLTDISKHIEYEAPEFHWRWKRESRDQLLAHTKAILSLINSRGRKPEHQFELDRNVRIATDLT